MRTEGIDLEDGGQPLLDLRFADDILAFATSSQAQMVNGQCLHATRRAHFGHRR